MNIWLEGRVEELQPITVGNIEDQRFAEKQVLESKACRDTTRVNQVTVVAVILELHWGDSLDLHFTF